MFGNDEEDDSRSLTDQLLDIKPRINTKDISNFNTIQLDEKSLLFKLSAKLFFNLINLALCF